jgi:hypothetical protein
MKRIGHRWLLGAVLAGLVMGAVRAEDEVLFFDRATKKEGSIKGTIQDETPAGIAIKGKGKDAPVKQIAAADVRQVVYQVAGVTAPEFRKPFVAEDKALKETRAKQRAELMDKAMDAFRDLEKELRGNANARRYIQYKIAQLATIQAKEDPTKTDAAIKELTAYKTANPSGWEIVSALKELAKLQEALSKTDEARKTYEELTAVPEIPKDVKLESELLVSRLLLRALKYADAEKRLKSLEASMPPDDPQRPYIQAYLADSQIGQGNLGQAETQLKEALKASADSKLRGVVHNLLGDYYRKKNQDEDAFWQYLRVDSLYNEDPEEQAKALYYLRTLFDKVKRDPARAKECANRLRDERFAGTTFQRLAGGDEKK